VVYTSVLAEGFVEATGGSDRVLLDTRLDDDLRREGVFREVAHRIQLARKDAGFDVTDRILLTYEAEAELAAILAENADELASEVLAVEIRPALDAGCSHRESIDVLGGKVTIALRRVSDDEEADHGDSGSRTAMGR